MLIFYTDSEKVTPVVSLQETQKTACNTVCSSNCIKPKSKCCNKYQKKGINCKRCPLTFDLRAVS